MVNNRVTRGLGVLAVVGALTLVPALTAEAYAPVGGTMYQVPDNQPCTKGRGNCVVYPKAAQLPSGRLVASFEQATVAPSGTADGETLPIYKSDDHGASWQSLAQVKAPAYASSNSAYAKYVSNWTNPYLYVLPQDVGNLKKGTLLLASVVSADDSYYKEQKAANPNFTPTRDGDRNNMAIALYSSTDSGVTWNVVNIIATGGWSNGAGNPAQADTYKEQDPVWEPYLMVYNNQLVAYYSDENDYTGYDATTGVPTLDPNNATAPDPVRQILVHKTWDGSSSSWSSPVVDVSGQTQTVNGHNEIGGGRPGMTNVVQTSDGQWMMTFEYFGGGDNVHYKIASNPLQFFKVGGDAGSNITSLPVTAGSRALTTGGSPVMLRLPDGRIIFNANGGSGGNGNGDVWINSTGSSTGAWTEYQTTLPAAYSRNLTFDATTGRVVLLAGTTGTNVRFADEDFGNSAGTYYKIVNRLTGQVIGTTNNVTDANIGNGDVPDVRLETAGSASNAATQLWHVTTKSDGTVALLNKAGGRSAAVWTGTATAGQKIGQYVDDTASGPFKMYTKSNGDVYFQSTSNTSLYLTGASNGASLTLQPSDNGAGSQDWQLVAQ